MHWIVFSYTPFKPKQGGYKCYHIHTCKVITQPYITVIPATPAIITTIDALSKSNGFRYLNISDLHGHYLFDFSMDPALLAGVDHADDEDRSFAGVPVPNTTVMTNAGNNSDAESDHISVDPNKADDNSSKASVHNTGSNISIHSVTSEPPQRHLDEEDNLSDDQTELDNVELPEPETKFLYHVDLKESVSHHLTTYLGWEAKHKS